MSTKEKYYLIYKIDECIHFHIKVKCAIVIPYNIFVSKLKSYYDKRNCDVEFEFGGEDWIETFKIKPRGKCFFYDLAYYDEIEECNPDADKVLKKIIFPKEEFRIRGIEQRYGKKGSVIFFISN